MNINYFQESIDKKKLVFKLKKLFLKILLNSINILKNRENSFIFKIYSTFEFTIKNNNLIKILRNKKYQNYVNVF